jgi:hypothetical protein
MVLSCKAPDGQKLEFELKMITRIGRGEDNDIQLFDSSTSTHHCELRFGNGVVTVHDLGSTNGITVNSEPVQEAVLQPGGRLRVGDTEFTLEDNLALIPGPSPSLDHPGPARIPGVCQHHPDLVADWRCSKCGAFFCSSCIIDGRKFGTPRVKFCPICSAKADDLKAARAAEQQKVIATRPLDPWKYPLRGEGLILLIAGTAFLALTSFVQNFALLLSGFLFVFSTGYLLAYSQKIITSTAHGDHEPPTFPDFSDFSQDILPPFLHALGLFALYLLPVLLADWFLPEDGLASAFLPLLLLLVALFLMPMAWLGVSMHEQMIALSPHFVIPSMLRIAGPYFLLTIQLIVLVTIDVAIGWTLDHLKIPIVPWVLGSFVGLYFLMVFSRLLGILYYSNKERLGWF